MTADLVCPAPFTKPSFPSFSEKKKNFYQKKKFLMFARPSHIDLRRKAHFLNENNFFVIIINCFFFHSIILFL